MSDNEESLDFGLNNSPSQESHMIGLYPDVASVFPARKSSIHQKRSENKSFDSKNFILSLAEDPAGARSLFHSFFLFYSTPMLKSGTVVGLPGKQSSLVCLPYWVYQVSVLLRMLPIPFRKEEHS